MEPTLIQKIAIYALPLIFAITLHEVAHGYVASRCGDQTARLAGRLTLNPLRHIDLVGTIIIPLLMLLVSPFIFGWAKPVPVDPRNMNHPRRDMGIVALAGPMANIAMAFGWALVAKGGMMFLNHDNSWFGDPLVYMGQVGIVLNIVLALVNLIPLPPLDGGNVLMSLLPPRIAYQFRGIEPYGFIIVLLLFATGILNIVIGLPANYLIDLIGNLFHLPAF